MISKEEVHALGVLARLALSDAEIETLQKDISNILSYVGQVNTLAIPPHTPDSLYPVNVLRSDTPYADDQPLGHTQEALLQAFPERQERYAVVRKILTKDA